MNTVFLYAGQGSQKPGMGKDFYEKYPEYRELVDSIKLEKDYKEIMHGDSMEELSKTENTQGCMALMAAGITELLKSRGINPDAACGLSLGEYGALYAAGVYSADEYVRLTAFRGEQMAKAASGLECAMSAVLGASSELVESTVADYKGEGFITVANYNCPGQCVICGDNQAVTQIEEALREKGVKKCVRLQVSGPFHTHYMAPAGDALKQYFENMNFNEPSIPVALNVTGKLYEKGQDLKEMLVRQVQSSVRMEDDLRSLIEAGARNFIEIGPGNAVSGFLKKTAKSMGIDVTVSSISTVEDFEKLVQ